MRDDSRIGEKMVLLVTSVLVVSSMETNET